MKCQEAFVTALIAVTLVGCGDSTTSSSPIGPVGPVSSAAGNQTVTASGVSVTESRMVTPFTALRIGVPGRLVIEEGPSALTIIGDAAVLAVIESDVTNGELVIAQTPNTDLRLSDPLEIEYRVSVDALERLDVAGTVQATVHSVDPRRFEVRVHGASSVTSFGMTEDQSVTISGSSRYDGRDLATRSTDVNVTGTGVADVNASDRLSGTVSGAGVLRYVGNPVVTVSVSGAGTVSRRSSVSR